MSLENWLKNGWLVEHQTSLEEITELFYLAERDLKDCQNVELSPDWRLSIAYNAALQSAKAALAAAGYRAPRESHHFRIIQSLKYTIHADSKFIAQLDMFRKKRNISDYERSGQVSEQEVKEIISLAKKVRRLAEKWIRSKYPSFR